jgi:hypothetical protein
MQSRAEVLVQIAVNEAILAELRWRKARASQVITDVLCERDHELTGEPFQRLLAEVHGIMDGSLPPGDAKPTQGRDKP